MDLEHEGLEPRTQKALRELEWGALLNKVAAHCASAPGRRALLGLLPEPDLDGARARMRQTQEALTLQPVAPLPVAHFEDVHEDLQRLALGIDGDGRSLNQLRAVLSLARLLARHTSEHEDLCPLLAEALASPPALGPLLAELERCVGTDGELLDNASPELARARRELQQRRGDLRQAVGRIANELGEALQGSYVAERDGRYVLPVRGDAPFRVEGLVLGSSGSGNTLYIEPLATHALGNQVQRAEAAARAEEARVLRALNQQCRAELGALETAQANCVLADNLRALAEYAVHNQALPLLPEAEPCLELKQMRHPLLLGNGREVVANDLALSAGSGLVLSGPNAGGKTVGLKCLGLAAWMARAGIPIPVALGSRIGFFAEVLTDIGDNQSLTLSLSTFSAHVRHVSECLQQARPGALILIDELAAGTDPEEGAALACVLVEHFVERGAALCITTHYEPLKILAARDPRLVNAAVGFDAERLAPTFRISLGAPGASSALLVAARHGLPDDVVAHAEARLPEALRERRALSAKLEAERVRLETEVAAAEAERAHWTRLRRELEADSNRARSEAREKLGRETERVLHEVRAARSRLAQAEAKLRQAREPVAQRDAERAASELAEFVSIGGGLRKATQSLIQKPAPSTTPQWEEIAIGDALRLKTLGTEGRVVAKPKPGFVTLELGAMKSTVGVEGLAWTERARTKTAESQGQRRGKKGANSGSTPAAGLTPRPEPPNGSETEMGVGTATQVPPRSEDNTCNLRGEAVDDALQRLDRFVDELQRRGEPAGFVLHGHGTGALKNAVRAHLRRHRGVSQSGPAAREDGGDAFTVLWLL
jgi:DNA mismatch repair protein MutS2